MRNIQIAALATALTTSFFACAQNDHIESIQNHRIENSKKRKKNKETTIFIENERNTDENDTKKDEPSATITGLAELGGFNSPPTNNHK